MFGFPSAEDQKKPHLYSDDGSPWGVFDNPYNIPNLKADFVPLNSPAPTGPWRAVEYPSSVFARESFVDEMAQATAQDPLELRLELLKPGNVLVLGDQHINRQRLMDVLQAAADRGDWTKPLAHTPERLLGRGIACNVYDADCYVAQVVEVSVGRDKQDIRVHRAVCAVDCGLAINPLGVEGQMESGFTWGLSAALLGKIDFKNGGAVQSSYLDFPVICMNQAPVFETVIVHSDNPPGGIGETAVPPVAPAVANAVFAATGKRVRRVPLQPELVRL